MTRLVTSLGMVIALTASAPAAQAGSYAFSIGGHRFHVEASRNCRSSSCVSISGRSLRTTEDAGAAPAPAPAPVVQTLQPIAPIRPAPAAVVPPPAPPAPVLAATTSQPVVSPPAPKLEAPNVVTLAPPRLEPPVVAPQPEIKQGTTIAQRGDEEPDYSPLGEWGSTGAKGTVRIERCGPALCGFVLTEALSRGESVLVNMKPKTHDVWTGSIYSRSSGSTYYGRMTLTASGKLRVEACAVGRFWCAGNDWTRVEEPREQVMTTARQWSGARS
jgi:Uncharacterized protein conserved in bacteria (DUF2147)